MSSARSSSLESQENTNVKRKRKEATEEELSDSEDDNVQPLDNTPEEEPVLSHAERRRRKKEEKLAANLKEDEGSAAKKRKLKDGSAKEVVPMKRQNSVWIGNLSFKTTQENLRTFLADVGEITRINMPTKRAAGPGLKPENRGYVHR
jgi:RNA recognition motif-containing protein